LWTPCTAVETKCDYKLDFKQTSEKEIAEGIIRKSFKKRCNIVITFLSHTLSNILEVFYGFVLRNNKIHPLKNKIEIIDIVYTINK